MQVIWQPGMKLADVEKIVIERAYSFYKNNKSQTAIALGIAVRTLDSKLEKFSINKEPAAERDERRRKETARKLHEMRNGKVKSIPQIEKQQKTKSKTKVAEKIPAEA